jgi:hypothetical protein
MPKYLFDVQQKNRLEQKGLLKRFSISCYGHQETLEEMRAEKANKYKELSVNRGSKEFQEWFLGYRPGQGDATVSRPVKLRQYTKRDRIFRKNSRSLYSKTFKKKNKDWRNLFTPLKI